MAPLHLAIGKDLEGSWPRLAWPTVEMVSSVENPAKSTNGCHGVIILPRREIQQKTLPWNWCKINILLNHAIESTHHILGFGRSFRDILKFVSEFSCTTLCKQIDQYLAMAQNGVTPHHKKM